MPGFPLSGSRAQAPLLALLGGAIAACGFQPLGIWPLALAGLALLTALIRNAPRLGAAMAVGWWFGLGHFVLGLNWIATSFTYQSNMPAWLGWIAVVLLSLYLAVYPAAAAGLAWKYGRRSPPALVLVLAAAWIVTEWLRATVFTGFAWNPIGIALLPTPLAQLAVVIGTYGLSAITVLVAGGAWLLAQRQWRSGAAMLVAPIAAAVLLSLSRPAGPAATDLRLRIVQPNIGQEDKWREGFEEENLKRLARLSQRGENEPRLLLWPEAAITMALEDQRRDPYYQLRTLQLRQGVGQLLGARDLLLTGGLTIRSTDGIDATSATNSIFAMDRSGRILARYDKSHLVPYGEYLPMRPLLSTLGVSRLAPGDIDFDPGPGPRTLELPLVGQVGFQLCYEIIFSGSVVDPKQRPAFLFNPSNDAWFGAWGPPQHLAQARLRALEEGLPILRSTPTGISAVIDADGRLLASLPWRTEGVIDTRLPAPRQPTPFARYGNLLPFIFALLLVGGAIAVRRKHG
jgi:apolipoprotein N-acyltransferase